MNFIILFFHFYIYILYLFILFQESVLQKYGIPKVRFDTIFDGPLPDFTPRPRKIVKQTSLDKFLTSDVTKHRKFEKPNTLKKVESGMVEKKQRKPRYVFQLLGKEEKDKKI